MFCHKNINQRKPNFSNNYRYKVANPRKSIELADEPLSKILVPISSCNPFVLVLSSIPKPTQSNRSNLTMLK